MGLGGSRHIEKGEQKRALAGRNGDGGEYLGGRKAGRWGQGAVGRIGRKYFPVVGDVHPYKEAYQEGVGGQIGAG